MTNNKVNSTADKEGDIFWNSHVAEYLRNSTMLIEVHICDLRMDPTFAVWRKIVIL